MSSQLPKLIPSLRADNVHPDLCWLIYTILDATKDIAELINKGAITNSLATTLGTNIQGETQKQLDVLSNDILKRALLDNDCVRAIASEEEDDVVVGHHAGKYVVAFDPLDGSSNIDVNGQLGTIFTIYAANHDVMPASHMQFQLPGKQQLCAGYVLYGASTLCVLTTGGPTRCYTLDTQHGNFLLTCAELNIPKDTQEFSINAANQLFWSDNFQNYIAELIKGENGTRKKRFNMRWNGAMVGDVHRTLIRGGIFMYPSDSRNMQQPAKLRLLYEANPMAMLVENAGGKAMTETQRILELVPEALHQRVAVIMGSANEVDACIKALHPNTLAA